MEGKKRQSCSSVTEEGGLLLYLFALSEKWQSDICIWCAVFFSATLALREMSQSAPHLTCFVHFRFFYEDPLLHQKSEMYLISLFHLTLMLKVSVFHFTCIPHPAIIQPTHTACSGDSGTSSLPSSSNPSCTDKNEFSLFYFPSFSDHYMSHK